MEFIKYFTNPQFDNAKFADMLRLKNECACQGSRGWCHP